VMIRKKKMYYDKMYSADSEF